MNTAEAQMIASVETKKRRAPKVVRIELVDYVGPYKLSLQFNDGQHSTVDFGPFLKNSAHPSIRADLNVRKFRSFTLEDGFLHWNDFDLVFPMAELYEGRIG